MHPWGVPPSLVLVHCNRVLKLPFPSGPPPAGPLGNDALAQPLQAVILRGESVARKVVAKTERREYGRVGRGLEDYLHMVELVCASAHRRICHRIP